MQLIYRVWFYLAVAIPILVFFPVLLVLTARPQWYKAFYWVARNIWARFILFVMGWFPRITEGKPLKPGKSYVLVANHTSMSDIMLMLWVSSNPFVFVGKKELVKIPVFGFFYKRICIMVDRNSVRSRSGVYKRAQRTLESGLSVCIFPEGGVPEESVLLDVFKDGAFKLSIDHQIDILPMVFLDNKKRFPFSLNHGGPGVMRVKIFPPIRPESEANAEVRSLKETTRNCILEALQEDLKEKKGSDGVRI